MQAISGPEAGYRDDVINEEVSVEALLYTGYSPGVLRYRYTSEPPAAQVPGGAAPTAGGRPLHPGVR